MLPGIPPPIDGIGVGAIGGARSVACDRRRCDRFHRRRCDRWRRRCHDRRRGRRGRRWRRRCRRRWDRVRASLTRRIGWLAEALGIQRPGGKRVRAALTDRVVGIRDTLRVVRTGRRAWRRVRSRSGTRDGHAEHRHGHNRIRPPHPSPLCRRCHARGYRCTPQCPCSAERGPCNFADGGVSEPSTLRV